MRNLNIIHKPSEIHKIRKSCKIVAHIHKELKKVIQPGLNTNILVDITLDVLNSYKAAPSFLNYRGFSHPLCVSINNEIVHGNPRNRVLNDGDLVSIDVGAYLDSYHGDAAFSVVVGNSNYKAIKLVNDTNIILNEAISIVKEGLSLVELGSLIYTKAQNLGYDVVKNYVGHGLGKNLHEFPNVYNYPNNEAYPILKSGMTIAIEPMLTLGSGDNYTLNDGWTVVTIDGSLACHFEHTILVHKNYGEILTIL